MEQYIIFPIASFQLTISNVIFYLIIATFITVLLGTPRTGNIIPDGWGVLAESLYRTILNMIENFIGPKFTIYLPLFYSLFHIILFSNILGLVPYSSTPTVEIVMTLSLAFTLLFGILLIGFFTHSLRLLAMFLPGGTPLGLVPLLVVLEVVAYLARTLSLGLRLAINLITGHILAKVCSGFIWLGYLKGASFAVLAIGMVLLTAFLTLEVLVAYLQAYIFLFIAMLTFKDITM